MKKISFDDYSAWSTQRGYSLDQWGPSLEAPLESVAIAVPEEPQALAALLDDLVGIELKGGAWLFRVRDWTIWNERSQEIGLAHLNLLTDSAAQSQGSESSHIYLLAASEWREVIALLTIPVLYGWDANLLFESGSVLVDVSHEGRIQVTLGKGHDRLRMASLESNWIAKKMADGSPKP